MTNGQATNKHISIEFNAQTAKIENQFKALSTSFGIVAQNMRQEMIRSSDAIDSRIQITNKVLELTKSKIIDIADNTKGLKKAIDDGFGNLNNILTSNNAKMDSAIQKLIAMHQQTRNIASANQTAASSQGGWESTLLSTFSTLKLMNMAWNTTVSAVRDAVSELFKLDNTIKNIATISGESQEKIRGAAFFLSNKSGLVINDIAKALQDAANEGNNVTASFEKINNAVLLSKLNMGNLANNIARIDDIVDQFNISASKATNFLLNINMTSERSLAIFGRLSRDAKEAGLTFEQFGSILSEMANKAGISERSLQVGFRALLNGLQDVGATGQKVFFDQLMPAWNSLSDAQKRHIESNLGLKENDEFLKSLGEHWAGVADKIKNAADLQDHFNSTTKENISFSVELNRAWNTVLQGMNSYFNQLIEYRNNPSVIDMLFNPLGGVAKKGVSDVLHYGREGIRMLGEIGEAAKPLTKVQEIEQDIINKTREMNALDLSSDSEQAVTAFNKLNQEINKLKQSKTEVLNLDIQQAQTMDEFKKGLETQAEVQKSLDSEKFNRMKDAYRLHEETMNKRVIELRIEKDVEELQKGKLAGLQFELKGYESILGKLRENLAKQKENHSNQEYTKKLEKEILEAIEKMGRIRLQIQDQQRKDLKDSDREFKKSSVDQSKTLLEKYAIEKTHIMELYEQGRINAGQTVMMLNQIEQKLKSHVDWSKLKTKEDDFQYNLLRKNTEQYEKQLETIEKTARADKVKMDDAQLKFERGELSRTKKGRNLTDREEIMFAEKELQLARNRASEIGALDRSQIMELNKVLQQKESLFKREGQQRTELWRKGAQIEISKIRETRDAKLHAFDVEYAAESALMAKKMALYEKTHVTQLDMQNILASHLQNSVGSVIDKLIFNTGSLSHLWTDLVKQILADMAKQAVSKGISLLLSGGMGGGFDIMSGVFGLFSTGTGMKGVPGYSNGTSMKGHDSYPAMLSPGEIVLDNNASDMFRSVVNGGGFNLGETQRMMRDVQSGGSPIFINIHSSPSLLGNREEIIRLDRALNNPSIRTTIDRTKL